MCIKDESGSSQRTIKPVKVCYSAPTPSSLLQTGHISSAAAVARWGRCVGRQRRIALNLNSFHFTTLINLHTANSIAVLCKSISWLDCNLLVFSSGSNRRLPSTTQRCHWNKLHAGIRRINLPAKIRRHCQSIVISTPVLSGDATWPSTLFSSITSQKKPLLFRRRTASPSASSVPAFIQRQWPVSNWGLLSASGCSNNSKQQEKNMPAAGRKSMPLLRSSASLVTDTGAVSMIRSTTSCLPFFSERPADVTDRHNG